MAQETPSELSNGKLVDDPHDHRPLEEITPAERARERGLSPDAGCDFPSDTHQHPANSGDALMGGNRLTPEQA